MNEYDIVDQYTVFINLMWILTQEELSAEVPYLAHPDASEPVGG